MNDRTDRIAVEIQKEISNIIQNEIKDPRLPQMVSVIKVTVTKDLKFSKVYVSVLGGDEEKKNCITALNSAAGFIRREVGHRVNLRVVPEFKYILDDSIEYSINLSKKIEQLNIKREEDGI